VVLVTVDARGPPVVYLWSVSLQVQCPIALNGPSNHIYQVLRRERPTRIELASSAWKAEVLPLNYGRGTGRSLSLYSQLRGRAVRSGRGRAVLR
jgi:hypothetical protein